MKLKAKSRVLTITALFFIFAVITIANVLFLNKGNETKNIVALTPEDKRAMNYNLVDDETGKIQGNDYVRFNAFFLRDLNNDGYAEKYDGTCRNITEKAMLYMDVNVLTEGKLINGKITIDGQNFDLGMSMIADEVLKNNYISNNVENIELKDMNAGTQKLILGKITPKIGNDTNKYSCDTNTITFTGTYVPLEGEPVEVSKTIDLTVDWYGITTAQMIKNTKYDVLADDIEAGEIKFNFEVIESAKELILKENCNKVKIPELCGYAPLEVKCTTSGVTSSYNEETKELTIIKESTINENGIVNSTIARKNTYQVSVKYPEEAYRAIGSYESIVFDIEGYYTGYNNQNSEFENPYKSNVVKDKVEILIRKDPKENIFNFYVDYINKRYVTNPYNKYVISNQDIINAYNSDDVPANKKFIVRWQAVRGNQGVVPSMIMSETKENVNYGDKWDTSLIEDYIENTGIYFTGADEMLGEDGTIRVYDNDTNELIEEFTSDEWNTYNMSNPFKYQLGVKHIRVETSTADTNSKLSVFNVKELNTDAIINKYTVEQIKEFNATHTYLTGICNIEGVGARDRKTSDIAYFIHEKSRVGLDIDKKTAIVYEKLNNQKIRIKTLNNTNDDAKWKNGEFIVEVPAEIMNMEINDVTCNKQGITIDAYELYQDENERYFIKIITKNDEPANYEIVVDCNLIPDPKVATVNTKFNLYAYNEYTHDYTDEVSDIYDVNQNNDRIEKVGKSEAKMDILAPTSLITLETITDYDETTNSEITIAPNVALVNREERQAKINIHLTNNYTDSISNIRVVGKIPYKNNTYILNGKDLKSEFTTQMTSNGIIIPEELPSNIKEHTTVYYSEKQNPTKDIDNAENEWKTKENVSDWSKIVSYIICIDDCKIASGQELKFNYDVTLPENVTLNMASFSTHAVYFNLNTEDGMIRLHTEPTKVGVRIVKKYELDLTKYRVYSNAVIPGVTYSLKYSVKNAEDEVVEKQSIITTDENGKIVIQGLFAGTEYTLKEIKVPVECELSGNEIKFIVDENEILTLTGENKNNSYSNSKLQLDLEDEIRAKLQINKTKKGTDIKLSNVIFDVADEEGNHLTGKTKNGYLVIPGILLDKTYILTEKSTPSELLKNNGIFKFKVYRNQENKIKLETIENTLLKGNAELEDLENTISPVVNVNIEDELRYTLNVLKKDKQGNALGNVVFELVGENGNVTFTTNKDGEYSLSRLNLGETYKLKEVKAAGCYLNSENDNSITFKVERNEATGKLELKEITQSGDTKLLGTPVLTEEGIKAQLSMVLENEKVPTYKLKIIKKNEDGEILPGARFELKRVADGKKFIEVTDQNGEIEFEGLYEDIPERGVKSEFELTEVYAPEGYRLERSVLKFTARRDENNKLVFNGIDGMSMIKDNASGEGKEIETDENIITLGIVNKSIFSIIKYDEDETLLPNAKFVITDLDGNPAKDTFGRYLGTEEIFDGVEGDIEFDLEAGNGWEFVDNVWKSEKGGSVLKSKQFEIVKQSKISFEYAATSDTDIYYQIIDESNSTVINNYLSTYNPSLNEDDINYRKSEIKLSPGKYTIIFRTNSYYSNNIFRLRNFGKIITTGTHKEYVVSTDENGRIKANLPQGSYKAVEVEAPAGYELPEKLDQRTFYFGIGESKDGVYSKQIDTVGWERSGVNGNVIAANDGGILVINSNTISHYNKDGIIVWQKEKNTGIDYVINSNIEGGYDLQCSYDGIDDSLDYDGNVINVVPSKRNFIKIKIDDNGNYVESNACVVESAGIYVGLNEYGNIILNDNWHIEEYNMNGELISECNICAMSGSSFGNVVYDAGVLVTKDGYISYGDLRSKVEIDENTSINPGASYVIMYNKNGEIQWYKNIGYNVGNVRYFPDIDKYIAEINLYVEGFHGGYYITGAIYEFDRNGNFTELFRDSQPITVVYDGAYYKNQAVNTMKYEDENGNEQTGYMISTLRNSSYSNNVNKYEVMLLDANGNIIYSDLINANSLAQDKEGNCYATYSGKYLKQYKKSIVKPEIQDLQELSVHNVKASFNITTKLIMKSNESNIRGSITGEYNDEYPYEYKIQYVETVKYGEDSSKEIVIEPGFNSFISMITINGKPITFEPDVDGKVILPSKYFTKITEDKLIAVRFEEKKATINIKKTDDNNNGIGGAKFIIKSSGKQYKLGELTGNGSDYYFTEQDGVYEPNNTYVSSSVAQSYIPLDLSNCNGNYEVKVNAEIYARYPDLDYGTVYITDSINSPNTNRKNVIDITYNPEPFTGRTTIEAGKQYYIFMEYRRAENEVIPTPETIYGFRINSISVNKLTDDEEEIYYAKTNENGDACVGVMNIGKYIIQEVEAPEGYVLEDEPQSAIITSENLNETVTFINKKKTEIVVHHYLEGTGEEFNNEPVVLADEETVFGKSGTSYTTAPNMEIKGYTLIKDANGKYKIPENATGTFTDEVQHVYYYYNTAPVELVVHHYLQGTEDKLADDEISSYEKGEHYKTSPVDDLLEDYDLVEVIGDEEKDITKDEEVTYYYAKKQHEITTRVETISYYGKPEKGGEISGEEEKPYEIVPHGDSNTKDIKMTPKEGFKIDQVVINQSEDGREISSEKLDIDLNMDDTYDLPQIQNVKNDYEVVVRYVPDMGKVIVHHYIEGTETSISSDEVVIDEYGNVVETKPISVLEDDLTKYVLVQSPSEPNVVTNEEDQEVTYYYQVQYKITTDVILHDETVKGKTVQVKGGSISGEDEAPYELVMREGDSSKIIKMVPDEGYKIKRVEINNEPFDFTEKLAEDGTLTLDKFTNMNEGKHITVEFEKIKPDIPAKVIVKYLEEGTDKVLKAEQVEDGVVGEEYTTTRAIIEDYEKAGTEPANANGIMTEEDIIVIYYYKKKQEEPTPVIPDDPTPVTPEPEPEPEPELEPEPEPVIPDEPDTFEKQDESETTKDVDQKQPVEDKQNDSNNEQKSPQTGDNIVVIAIIGIVAAVAFVALLFISKKKKTSEKNKGFDGKHF